MCLQFFSSPFAKTLFLLCFPWNVYRMKCWSDQIDFNYCLFYKFINCFWFCFRFVSQTCSTDMNGEHTIRQTNKKRVRRISEKKQLSTISLPNTDTLDILKWNDKGGIGLPEAEPIEKLKHNSKLTPNRCNDHETLLLVSFRLSVFLLVFGRLVCRIVCKSWQSSKCITICLNLSQFKWLWMCEFGTDFEFGRVMCRPHIAYRFCITEQSAIDLYYVYFGLICNAPHIRTNFRQLNTKIVEKSIRSFSFRKNIKSIKYWFNADEREKKRKFLDMLICVCVFAYGCTEHIQIRYFSWIASVVSRVLLNVYSFVYIVVIPTRELWW